MIFLLLVHIYIYYLYNSVTAESMPPELGGGVHNPFHLREKVLISCLPPPFGLLLWSPFRLCNDGKQEEDLAHGQVWCRKNVYAVDYICELYG